MNFKAQVLSFFAASVLFPMTSLGAVNPAVNQIVNAGLRVTQPNALAVRELKTELQSSFASLRPEMEPILVSLVRQAERIEKNSDRVVVQLPTRLPARFQVSAGKNDESVTQRRSL